MKYEIKPKEQISEELRSFNGNFRDLIAIHTEKPNTKVEHEFESLIDKYRMQQIDGALHEVIFIGLKYEDQYIIPNYQRDLVWSVKQKQDFIISVLIDNPIGDFVFKENKLDQGATFHYTVIDGQQRINALREFIMNQYPMEDGRYFSELLFWDQRRIFEKRATYYTVPEASIETEIDIYVKRNMGGTAHTKAEINKALKVIHSADTEQFHKS